MWVRAPLFPMFYFHIKELKFKSLYYLMSFIITLSIIWLHLDVLFQYSPFYFLHSKWDDAFYAFFLFSFILSFFWTSPFLLTLLFLWLLPALFPHERISLILSLIYLSFSLLLYFCCFPALILLSPTFFTTFHSDSFLFTPNILDLLSVFLDVSAGILFIFILPLFVYFHISRPFLYLFSLLIASIFADLFSFLLILLPLILLIEWTFFMYYFLLKWFSSQSS